MSTFSLGVLLALGLVGADPSKEPLRVTLTISRASEVDLGAMIVKLAEATGVSLIRPPGGLNLPVRGVAGGLVRSIVEASLGSDVSIRINGRAFVVSVNSGLLAAGRRAEWERRLQNLADEAERESRRRRNHGMRSLRSYRPNDATRPTVCLVHGVNSSSGGFVHMIPHLEEAGFGVVVYDYPYNRSLEDSCRQFAVDWSKFRRDVGEERPWAIVGHSMGCLLGRDYVEGPSFGNDVSALIMIAPVNHGSHLARTQTLLQLINGVQAVSGRRTSDAIAQLGDGLGEAAEDMTPGSVFLRNLNARPRRSGVAYHIIAGDLGLLSASARSQIEAQISGVKRRGGLFGGLTGMIVGDDLKDRLDEVTDGTGDGCVSVRRSKLEGVADHVVIHANHAELIRAPLLFKDPGPVVCMPYLLRWLGKAVEQNNASQPVGSGRP